MGPDCAYQPVLLVLERDRSIASNSSNARCMGGAVLSCYDNASGSPLDGSTAVADDPLKRVKTTLSNLRRVLRYIELDEAKSLPGRL